MKLTREEALRLHREMWTAMKEALGDCPEDFERIDFKRKWCKEHFPNEKIESNCFLCEYVRNAGTDMGCNLCPIAWDTDNGRCSGAVDDFKVAFADAPISWVLAQKEREEADGNETD